MKTAHLTLAVGLAAVLSACVSTMPAVQGTADPATKAALDRFASSRCNDTVAAALAGAGVPASAIRSYSLETVPRQTGSTYYGSGIDGWVGLNGQQGTLVVSMTDSCSLHTVYGRDGMAMSGRG